MLCSKHSSLHAQFGEPDLCSDLLAPWPDPNLKAKILVVTKWYVNYVKVLLTLPVELQADNTPSCQIELVGFELESLALARKYRISFSSHLRTGSFLYPARAPSFYSCMVKVVPFRRGKEKVRKDLFLFPPLLFYWSRLILLMKNFPSLLRGNFWFLRHW